MIYLDANSTSMIRPEVKDITDLLLQHQIANPSSVHHYGRNARAQLQTARRDILRLLNLKQNHTKQRLVFTSGATEACNQMILGFLGPLVKLGLSPGHIVTSAIEHPAVLETVSLLEKSSWKIERVNPNAEGIVDVDAFVSKVTKQTALVSLMAANNETGAIQPVMEISRKLREQGYAGAIVSDFTQVIGKALISLEDYFNAGVNAIAISAHKIGALAGVGALVINESSELTCFSFEPLIRGGSQEMSYRGGTENLFGAMVFAAVSKNLSQTLAEEIARKEELRELLWNGLKNKLPFIKRLTPNNSDTETKSLSNTLLLQVEGCRGDDLVVALDLEGLAVSTGSACSSGKQKISHVVTAMGLNLQQAREVIRISIDWSTNRQEITDSVDIIARIVSKSRERL
ncbi:MAG: cysteine desulfurase [Proteobacteria bacterium]|nr:cysteine desulfurase [Pseudomonadota bacterium]